MLTTLRNAKKIPFASKFLSTGLISFDVGYFTCTLTAVKKFQKHPVIFSQTITLTTLLHQLSYCTMAAMAVERMLVLKWPMKYLRYATKMKIKSITIRLWGCFVLLFCLARYLLCWAKSSTTSALYSVDGNCGAYIMFYHIVIVSAGQTISTISYIVVLRIVRRQVLKDYHRGSIRSIKRVLRLYKSTGMVFIYIIVMTITFLTFYITIALRTVAAITREEISMIFEFAKIFNCVLDPLLYVLWFTECRLEFKRLINKMLCRPSGTKEDWVFQVQYAVQREEAQIPLSC